MAHKELAVRTLPQAALIEDKRPGPRLSAEGPSSAMLIYADTNNHCDIDRGSLEADQHSMIAALHEQGLDTHDVTHCSTLAESLGVRVDGLGGTVAQQLHVTGGWIGLLRLAFEPQSCLVPSFRSLWDTSQCGPW